jgi:dephospho-CoA kinase
VGLTGGIGAGKSTAAARLAARGAVLVDADQLAREVVQPGSDGLAAVVAVFGAGVLTASGSLDRPALGRRVFGDDAARARLNGILHPRIAALTAERISALPAGSIVVHDVPLLVENGMGANYHLVLVVHAPVEERLRRLLADRGMTERDATARIAAQADDTARRATADVWLDNSGSPAGLEAEVDALWEHRLAPFEANLRERRPAEYHPAAVRVVDPDPSWPVQAARLTARIGRAVGSVAVRIDHHGSTAVPGLAAEDLLDLQLVVADLEVADEIRPALDAAGFVRREGRWWDRLPDGTSGDKRMHGAADPARAVNLHVRALGGPAWQDVLMFRDWLRSQHAERDAYAELKRAAQGVGIQEYLDRKDPWIAAGLGRASAWARASGWYPGD